jgi:hypothetical protein
MVWAEVDGLEPLDAHGCLLGVVVMVWAEVESHSKRTAALLCPDK